MECTETCWKPVVCVKCKKLKAPLGRDIAAACAGSYCDFGGLDDCDGYFKDPQPPHLWPGEELPETD